MGDDRLGDDRLGDDRLGDDRLGDFLEGAYDLASSSETNLHILVLHVPQRSVSIARPRLVRVTRGFDIGRILRHFIHIADVMSGGLVGCGKKKNAVTHPLRQAVSS